MIRKISGYFALQLVLLLGISSANSASQPAERNSEQKSGTRELLVATGGNVTMDLGLDGLNGTTSVTSESKRTALRFEVGPSSFFTIRLINDSMRDAAPGTLALTWKNSGILPEPFRVSSGQLVIERMPSDSHFELVVKDAQTGFVFFNIEGHLYDYDAAAQSLRVNDGRLLISPELASKLGRPALAGTVAGEISISANMRLLERSKIENGVVRSSVLPARRRGSPNDPNGSVPGPDIVVGDMNGLQHFGSAGTQVGLGTGATSCNNGDQTVHFYQIPNPDHSVVSQNLYRMSGGASNNDRFEQIGHSWNKHTFGAAQENACGFGCDEFPGDEELGVGCSDPYSASQNAFQGNTNSGALGSRAWINPFTGAFPISPRPENHTSHTHTGTSHRLLVERNNLNTTMNPGATYYLEVQYDTMHEYAWCQTHPGECNMYNNASYRRYNVSGTTGQFSFAAVGATVRMTPATGAWTGATSATVEPAPGVDGRAFVVYKVSNPSAGVWHYEYAIHNQNLDRAIQSFSVPLGAGITINNIGFHAPPNHPGFPNDGTVGNLGFSNTPWTPNQTANDISWTTETLAQNPNANAIRFATTYTFRFDSDRPPTTATATVGFFKTGEPITVQVQGPVPEGGVTPTPTPGGSATPTATPGGSVTPTATPGGSVTPTPTPGGPTPTPNPVAQAVNLSTRLFVQTGDNAAFGGFIINGTAPKQVLIRGIGPSLADFGVPNVLADPTLELFEGTTSLATNNNWRDTQEQAIIDTGIPPTSDAESAIVQTLNPGAYTAVLRGVSNGVGVALVEIYDLTPNSSKMGNISTRGFVDTGDNALIAGVIVDNGVGNDTIVVRGIGPSLSEFGVPSPLADPTLELRNGEGTVVRSNNDWQDDQAQADQLNSFGLAPSNALEAGLVESLAPAAYTAILAGASNGTGVGVVEVYDNPEPAGPTPTPGPTGTPGATATPGPTGTPGATPTPTPGVPCTENFDSVTPPTLPPGWTASNPVPGDGVMWVTTTVTPDTAPNDAFIPDQDGISDKVLDRTGVTVNSAAAILTFRNNFSTEFSDNIYWDGGVLEVSSPNISNGDFLDVTDPLIGGTITAGGYTGEISGKASNPLAGRMAWSSSSGGYIDSVINLGPNVNGQTITLRWRFGTDELEPAPGWWIDTISIVGASCP